MTEIISAIRRGAAELLARSGGNSASDGGLFDEALNAALSGTQSASPRGNGRDLPGDTRQPTGGRAVGTQADAPDQGVDFVLADDAFADGALTDADAAPVEQTSRAAQWRAVYGQLLSPGLAATARDEGPGAVGIPGALGTTGITGDSGSTDTEGAEDGQIAKNGKAADTSGDARRAAGMGGGSLTPIPGRPAAAGVPTAGHDLTSATTGTLSSVGAPVLAPAGLPAGNGAATPTPGVASAGANAVVAAVAGGDVVSAEPAPGIAQAAARVDGNAAPGASLPTPSTPSTLSALSSPTATAGSPSPQAGQSAVTAPTVAPPPANTTPAQPGLPATNGSPVLTSAEAAQGGFAAEGESAQETSLPASATSRSAASDATAPNSVKVGDAANPAPAVPTAASMPAHTAGLTAATVFTTAAGATGATTATAAAAPAATGAGSDAAGSEADRDAAPAQIDRAAAEGSRADTDADDGSDSRRGDFHHRDFAHRDSNSVEVVPHGVARGERPMFEVPREMGRGAEGAAQITQNPSITGAERVTPPPTFAPAAPPAPIAGAPAHTPLPAHSQVMQAVGPLLRGADGSYQISLHLDPAGLGRVRVQVEMRGGEVSIQMLAADGGARDMLRDNLDQLRQQFAEMGLKSGSLAVEAGGADGENPWEGLDAHTDDDRQGGGGADTTGRGAGDATDPIDPTIQRGPSGDGALDVRI